MWVGEWVASPLPCAHVTRGGFGAGGWLHLPENDEHRCHQPDRGDSRQLEGKGKFVVKFERDGLQTVIALVNRGIIIYILGPIDLKGRIVHW